VDVLSVENIHGSINSVRFVHSVEARVPV